MQNKSDKNAAEAGLEVIGICLACGEKVYEGDRYPRKVHQKCLMAFRRKKGDQPPSLQDAFEQAAIDAGKIAPSARGKSDEDNPFNDFAEEFAKAHVDEKSLSSEDKKLLASMIKDVERETKAREQRKKK